MDHVIGFAIVVGILTLVPGVDTILVLRNAVGGGSRLGVVTAAGVIAGCLTWALASGLGIAGVLAASQRAFGVLQLIGALYLLWLGGRALWGALRHTDGGIEVAADAPAITPGNAFRMGLVNNLLNPKVGVFYLSILPQFLPTDGNVMLWSMGLASIHAIEGMLWFGGIALLVGKVRTMLQHPAVSRWLNGISGVALIGFGMKILLDARRRLAI